jgi:hypothetical protein
MAIACDRVLDLAPGFVLGALDAQEMADVRAHLAACAKPHPELREMGGVLSYLGGSLDPVEPPRHLRAAVMAAVQADMRARTAERVAPAAVAPTEAEPEAAPVLTVLAPARTAGVVSLARVRSIRTRRAAAWITRVAAAVAIVGLVGYAVTLQSDLNKAHEAQDHAATVYNYMQDPGARSAVLTPQGGNKGAGDAVLLQSGHVFVLLHGLQPTKADEVYMVWLSSDSGPLTKAGWFTVGDQGEGFLQMINVPPSDSLWVMVCREQNSSVEKPSDQVVVTGTIWVYSAPAPTPTN